MNKTFLIIDSMNMFFRGVHTVSKGASIDMQIGMSFHTILNSMRKAWRTFDADHIVYCMEGRSWRKDIYPEYKLNRKLLQAIKPVAEQENDALLLEAFNDFSSVINTNSNMTVLQYAKAEADDMIALFVQSHPDDVCIIVSTDTDFLQLLKHKNVILYDGVKDVHFTHQGVYDEKGRKREFIVKSDSKIKINDVNEDFVPESNWYEFSLFLKIIRGDKSDHVFSAFPGVRIKGTKNQVGIREAFDDRHSKGFAWNNFMLSKWTDHNNKDQKVRDRFEFNKQLINLECQPDEIKIACLAIIEEAIAQESVPAINIGMNFMKFCSRWDLKKISDYPNDFIDMYKGKYD